MENKETVQISYVLLFEGFQEFYDMRLTDNVLPCVELVRVQPYKYCFQYDMSMPIRYSSKKKLGYLHQDILYKNLKETE